MLGNLSGPSQPRGPPVLQPILAAPATSGARGYVVASLHVKQAQLGPVLGPARPESAAAAEQQPKKLVTASVDQELTAFMPSALRGRRTAGAPTNQPKRARAAPPTQLTTGRALFPESVTAHSQPAPPAHRQTAKETTHQPTSSGGAGEGAPGGRGGDAFAEFMAEMGTLAR